MESINHRINDSVSALTTFRKLQSEIKTVKWTKSKQEAAVCIGNKIYDSIMDDYSPALNEFLTSNNHQAPTSIIDCYAQTNLIIDKCAPADFQSPDKSLFDMAHLQTAVDGRHATVHEQDQNLLLNWKNCFNSMVYVSTGIGAHRAATRIAKVRDELVVARCQAKREIKLGHTSPISRHKSTFFKAVSNFSSFKRLH